jgi:4-hydroxythreonine-4-phosphate dehydrogenase
MGDPAGIGPEIVVKALADERVAASAGCVVLGDRGVLENAMAVTGAALTVNSIETPEQGDYREGVLNLIEATNIHMPGLTLGRISGMCGKAAFDYIVKSIELANARKVAAVATGPINKESLKAGGVDFIGHTEIFGALTDTPDPLTMFEVRGLRVFFLSRHVSLRRACDLVTKERIMDYVKRCGDALRQLGVEKGVMAIAGLNPHSGEHGLFGSEETDAVEPAVRELKAQGFQVEGPIGADSVFAMALGGRFNSVLSLYHDQGHIATKTLDFERTISVTCGMPILRTSVDHGTAFDIAGKNIASAVSMAEAILVAAKYSGKY